MRRTKLITLITFFIFTSSYSQQTIFPLSDNPQIKNHLLAGNSFEVKKSKEAANDSLPFFEDFSRSEVFPDPSKWMENKVFINNTMAKLPPSYNVATFDGLNEYGNAYENTSQFAYGPADTLTSKGLDLSLYQTTDQIYFSFFYQSQGNGDEPEIGDSLILEFKNQADKWNRIWAINGGVGSTEFKQVLISITNPNYLHGNFQFRFRNYASLTGNFDHWNIDYIKIERGRNPNDTLNVDVTLISKPGPLLKRYYSMPWKQFKANPALEKADSFRFLVRNLNNTNVQIPSRYRAFNKKWGTLIYTTPFTLASLQYGNPQKINYASFNFDTLAVAATDSVEITNLITVKEPSDVRPLNDSLYYTQGFYNYFSYDDGTAEAGYGFTNGVGKVALKFEANQADTLRAIDVYFNQSEKNVTGQNFILTLWSQITPPGTGNQNQDIIQYRQGFLVPKHDTVSKTGMLKGFARFFLDTPQAVSGSFLIGWQQNLPFVLNVGWDKNYPENFNKSYNENLFYNTLGYWNLSGLPGTVMMRPVLSEQPIVAPVGIIGTKPILPELSIYPNPASNKITIGFDLNETSECCIFSSDGKLLSKQIGKEQTVDVSNLEAGSYFLIIFDSSNEKYYQKKFIKLK